MMYRFDGMKVTQQIILFRNFLVSAWPDLELLMENHDWEDDGDFTGDWMQVNWEFLVERELLGREGSLSPFRLSHLDTKILPPAPGPKYSVIAVTKVHGEQIYDLRTKSIAPFDSQLRLCSFRILRNEEFEICPPFDLAVLTDTIKNKQYTFYLDKLDFFLHKIP